MVTHWILNNEVPTHMSRPAEVEYAAITPKFYRSHSTVKNDKTGKVIGTGKSQYL